LDALARFADHRLARNHLGHVQARAKLPNDFAERHVGDARHRRQNDGAIDFNIADLDWFQLHFQNLPKI
jgi:hypothetical protein